MLVLSRKNQESVVVGGISAIDRRMVVTVLGIQGGKVRLGFDVPIDVPVHRREGGSGSTPKRSETTRESNNYPDTKGLAVRQV
jgi:carbon storage regulator CsrA